MDPDFSDEILTFDELLEDDYYKSEFEKRVQQRVEEYSSHSGLKGGNDMNDNETVQNEEIAQAEAAENAEQPVSASTADDSSAINEAAERKPAEPASANEPLKEMSAEQYARYNETLRSVSKTAAAGLTTPYNAFDDGAVKAEVKRQILAGETPDVKALAKDVIDKRTQQDGGAVKPQTAAQPVKQSDNSDELLSLKAENALLKAGIKPDRIDAARKLFVAEGFALDKASEFVAKYPEWKQQQEGGYDIKKGAPLGGPTAPTPNGSVTLNDFEKKVMAARKARGLDYKI